MKRLYHIQFLFLLIMPFIIYGMKSLSPSALSESISDIRKALDRLSPLRGQTIKDAYIFLNETYSLGQYNRTYITDKQEQEELRKIEEAYVLLSGLGLNNARREEVENFLLEKSRLSKEHSESRSPSAISPQAQKTPILSEAQQYFGSPDNLSFSFGPRSPGAASAQAAKSSSLPEDQSELRLPAPLSLSFVRRSPSPISPQPPKGLNLFEDQRRGNQRRAESAETTSQSVQVIRFKNKDEALKFLGFDSSHEVSLDMIKHRMALLELDHAIGTFSDEDLIIAKEAYEYLKSLQ